MRKIITILVLSIVFIISGCTNEKEIVECNGESRTDLTAINDIYDLEDGDEVKVCGIITVWDSGDNFFIQDDTNAIYVAGNNNLGGSFSHNDVGNTIVLNAVKGTYKDNVQLKITLNSEYEIIQNSNRPLPELLVNVTKLEAVENKLVQITSVNISKSSDQNVITNANGDVITLLSTNFELGEYQDVTLIGTYYQNSDGSRFVVSDIRDIQFDVSDNLYALPTDFVYDGPSFPQDKISVADFWSGDAGLIEADLASCVDGDTARFNFIDEDGRRANESFRYLVVDTAETNHPEIGAEPFGKPASNYMCDLLSDAEDIYLQSDPVSGSRDDHGRMLGWIWADGELVQYNLVALGLADDKYAYYDGEAELYADLLMERVTQAKAEKVGRWSGLRDPYWDYENNRKLGW
jgi:micrococcal nuclease